MQQQLIDLLALAASITQTRWTARGPGAERLGPLLRATADAVGDLAESTAQHMVGCGWLPNGTAVAQLIAEIDIRAPEWWPAADGTALAAADVADVEGATAERAATLDALAPRSAALLRHQAAVLRECRAALVAGQ